VKKHTFVICAYKESEYLEECIKSLVVQRDTSEVILMTSTPNNHINTLCDKYEIPCFVNSGESGITQDWEFGLQQVKTKYATIAHQDDVYFKDYAKAVLERVEKSQTPIIAFTDYYELRDGDYVKENQILKIKRMLLMPLKIFRKSVFVRRRVLSLGNPICCPSVTYAMDNIERPFFMNHFKSNEDWEAWERYSKIKGEFLYIAKPLMAHRIHEGSETSAILEYDGRSVEDYEMYRKFWPNWIARYLTNKYKQSEKYNNVI